MAKDPKKNVPPPRPETARVRWFTWLGGAAAVPGAVMLGMVSRLGLPEWGRNTAIVLVVVGAFLLYLGTMPRDQALEWIKSLAFAIGLALLIRWPIAEPYRIPSGSMETTLHGDPRLGRGDRVFVNKWIYGVRVPFMNKRLWHGQDPQRWDIVVFKAVEEKAEHGTLVKRIVGLPGETIQIRDGKVYADGEPLTPPKGVPKSGEYTSGGGSLEQMRYGVLSSPEYAQVPGGHYLVLGDNSGSSRDGRYFGWLPNEHIVGRVASIWWPPTRWRDFTGFSTRWWWHVTVALVGALLFIRLFIGRSWVVPRKEGKGLDHLFVGFLSLGLRLPFTHFWLLPWGNIRRGDLVLYRPKDKEIPSGTVLLGRIAGLPAETAAIEDGKLTIDGDPVSGNEELAEADFASTDPKALFGRSRNKNHRLVPGAHYFILHQNPDSDDGDSLDSRVLGWIPRKALLGKAASVWWPPKRWRRLP